MEIVRVRVIFGGNFPSGNFRVGVILGGNCPGGSYPGGNFPGGSYPGWELSGGNHLGGIFPARSFGVTFHGISLKLFLNNKNANKKDN